MVYSNFINTKMNTKNQTFIICGTGTDVGKTIVSALFVQGLNAVYWKPVQSGLSDGGDTGRIKEILNISKDRWIPEKYKFKAPVSPHWAAEKEQKTINPFELTIPKINKPLIIETAGGLMVPLNRNWLQIDQLKEWNKPVILVSRTELGTLNHTLLSIEALRSRGIPLLGIFLNGTHHQDNPKTIEEFGKIKIIGHLDILEKISKDVLKEQWNLQKIANKLK